MKLYTAKISPYAARCRMQVYAKGLDRAPEVVFVEYPTEVSREQITALNPINKIPFLQIGDAILPESETICEYLEDRFPEPRLIPDDIDQRARMRLLTRIGDLYLMGPLTPLFAHLSRKHRDQKVVDQGLVEINQGLHALESYIADSGYAVGDGLTLADCCLAPQLVFLTTYMPFLGVKQPLQPYSKSDRYWSAIQDDPHAARVIEEIREGIAEKTAKK